MTPENQIETLTKERQELVDNYNQAVQTQAEIKTRLVEIQGAIKALSELTNSDEDENTDA